MKISRGLMLAVLGLVWLGGAGRIGGLARAQSVGSTAGKRPMTFADLMAMKRVSDPQISPSGKWVMFSVTEVSLEKNEKVNHLWVAPLKGAEGEPTSRPKEVQGTRGGGESNGRFSPDGRWVSWTAGDQIMVAAWDEAAGKVGEGKALTSVSTGADGAIWSPDSKRLMFVSSVYPECSDKSSFAEEDACDKAKDEAAAKSPVKAQIWDHLLYRHWNAYTGEKRSHVLVVSAADGKDVRDLTPRSAVGDAETPTFSLGGPLGYCWAPDSKEIAYVTNLDTVPAASTNNDVFTLRLDEPGAKAAKVSTSPGSDDGPAYSPDGKWLAFRSQARAGFESDRFRLMLFDRAAGTTKELMPKFDRWVDEFVWSVDSKSIYFASGVSGSEQIFSVEGDGKNLSARTTIGIVKDNAEWGEYGDLRVSGDGHSLVATRMTVSRPTELYLMHLGVDSGINVDAFPIAGSKPPAEGTLGSAISIFYKGELLTHMNQAVLDSLSYRWNWELMAADGYVVVGVNRRGSTGYGQKFVDEVSGDWGGKAYVDLMKGLDAAEAKFPFIDKTRECALGASYGGYMANWILTHTNRFKCIVTHDGMYNPAAAYGDTEELWFNEWEFRRGPVTGAAAWDKEPAQPWRYEGLPAEQDPFRRWSPMLHMGYLKGKDAKTPTLVIHSQKDYRLDVSEGFQLFTALQRLGVPSKMLYFPDEGHWVLKPQNSQLWYETVGDWCDKWTKTGKYAGK
jgi:dipeptidyl aminopeptidase/acylaminoacyl peptidase